MDFKQNLIVPNTVWDEVGYGMGLQAWRSCESRTPKRARCATCSWSRVTSALLDCRKLRHCRRRNFEDM